MPQFSRLLLAITAGVLVLLRSSDARADTLSVALSETRIPDATLSGLVLSFPSLPSLASIDKINVTISHEWLGDLTLKLIPPVGDPLVLVDRLQVAEDPPDGSSALLGAFEFVNDRGVLVPRTYQFAAAGTDIGTAARLAVDTLFAPILPVDDVYAAKLWQAGPFAAGDWRLQVIDAAEFSNGAITTAQVTYTTVTVPEPRILLVSLASLSLVWLRSLCPRRLDRPSTRAGR